MNKKIKRYILPVILLAGSILLRIATATDFFDSILRSVFKEEIIVTVKKTADFLDYLIFIFPLGIHSIRCAKDATRCREIVTRFGQNQRELVSHWLLEEGFIEGTSDDISIRVFKKKFGSLVLEDNMKFCSREITGKLSFSIRKQEGLCTKAYSEKHSMLEIEDGSKKQYNLTNRQKALAGELKFIVAVPISDDSTQSIKRVICFDSFQKIAKTECEEGILKICEQVAYNLNSVIDEG